MKALIKSTTVFSQVVGLVVGNKFTTPAPATLKYYPTLPYGV